MERSKKIIQVSVIGIAANLILVALKAFVGIITGSIAIIMDAVNNLSDALSSIITIIGTKLAGKAPDKKTHMATVKLNMSVLLRLQSLFYWQD